MDQRQAVKSQPRPPRTRSGAGLTLAMNAAENLLQIALADAQGAYVYGMECPAASQGAEKLAPALAAALASVHASPSDIGRIACVRGPGSFTGLRLTAVTAAGLARAGGALQAGLEYPGLLARDAASSLRPPPRAQLWILVRARRDLVYAQGFHAENPSAPRELHPLQTASPETAAALIRACSGDAPLLLAGSGLSANLDFLQKAFADRPNTSLIPHAHDNPRLRTLAAAALDAACDGNDITPFYARPSDAEENLRSIAARLGLDPDAAEQRLRVLTSAMPE